VQQNKTEFYASLNAQLSALLSGERNPMTNLSQFSAFIFMHLDNINWAGFYLMSDSDTLKLGPFQGKIACTTIPIGKGVCGTAAQERKSLVVEDVDQFDGHIACDAASRSEVVCPLIVGDQLIGVLDIDSPSLNRFDKDDALGLEKLVDSLLNATDF